jgi:AcrR family transcriptional regulator
MVHKKKQTEDLRVQRTRKLLMQALNVLIVEKGFLAITVQDIVNRAVVNRSTFYRHYRDKYDLLAQYMNEVYKLASSDESIQSHSKEPHHPPAGMVRMFEHVQMHADFYRVILGGKGDPGFVQRIQQYTEMRLREVYGGKLKSKDPPPDVCLSYLSYAGIGVMTWWLNHGQSYTPRQIASWIVQLNKGILSEVHTTKA